MIPGLVQTSLIVPLAPAGTEVRLPRLVQLDLGATKSFRVRNIEMEGGFQLFNVLNASEILLGRFPRISLQMKW